MDLDSLSTSVHLLSLQAHYLEVLSIAFGLISSLARSLSPAIPPLRLGCYWFLSSILSISGDQRRNGGVVNNFTTVPLDPPHLDTLWPLARLHGVHDLNIVPGDRE
ncbi:hypothetical protein F5876DRAFT_84910 [Lentinula aff. lateritia]|uniref:Uncharacterized protein n=1 Tax=Lentinula aff. lateritia TaxID=2804960 RepID=A0ACC1TFV0_9AGAR|nr:hypothetical protein F5876DRAFT_84910 [Lentinula aff. lateritia]